MSVAAEQSRSPNHFGHKRHFERTDSTEYQPSNENRSKRSRRRSSTDLEDLPQKGAPSDRASTLVALRGLFPNMEEKVRLPLIFPGFIFTENSETLQVCHAQIFCFYPFFLFISA